MLALPNCPTCRNRRHIRTNGEWSRCACLTSVINIKPIVRGGETRYPELYDQYPPYPLRDLTIGGVPAGLTPEETRHFRYMVWRSLLQQRETLVYEYLDAYRLVDMQFERDPTYDNPRDLVVPDLVILILGVTEVPNKLLGPLVSQLVSMRRFEGKPTWVYTPMPLLRLREEYGWALADMIGAPVRALAVK